MNWAVIVILICLLLAIFMVWKEYKRPNRLRLTLRTIATLLALAALACIALPVSYSSKTISGINNAVLLTPGFNADSLKGYSNSALYTTDISLQKNYPKLKINLIADLADIPQGKLNINNLHIWGYGLNSDELRQLGNYPIRFHPSVDPPGFRSINWNHKLKIGERLTLQGKFNGAPSKTTLILKGLNTTLDSVNLSPNNNSGERGAVTFQLQTTPKNLNRAVYTLLAVSGRDTIARETIPFEVEANQALKILMLNEAPNFENRFLKNWLSQNGYGVTVRTAISKQKFSREYLNMAQTPVDGITQALLQKFDLVIGDLSSFKLLSSAESSALEQQMAQKGLGVIVRADSSGKGNSFLSGAFPLDRLSDKNQKAVSLNIGGPNTASARLTLDAIFIKPQPNTQPLVTDGQNHIIVSSTIYGSSKIVFSTLSNTFNWVLSGNQTDYTLLWNLLIDKAARKSTSTQKWHIVPALPVVNGATTITAEGPQTLPIQIKVNNSPVAFAQNPVLPFSWSASYWPANYGWQQVLQNGVTVYWWYAFIPTQWLSLHAAENSTATQKYAMQHSIQSSNAAALQSSIKVPIPKIYFYLLLLFCCTFLWVERKV
ncbi:hypothetical protein BDD43_5310 [Mucilaginibacter gracilis]|uniref:Uncharacterized protein n=1 Tax=Mucilaginibacter gracilis TaxID=423350 RepID=A0A495J9H7_9SPHI|nr:hypothetical protein [Mucilaginibacter gracilis]RKR85054.1 hypothetical protein BDD43_5310 [Mucilaginibacter gracilis]